MPLRASVPLTPGNQPCLAPGPTSALPTEPFFLSGGIEAPRGRTWDRTAQAGWQHIGDTVATALSLWAAATQGQGSRPHRVPRHSIHSFHQGEEKLLQRPPSSRSLGRQEAASDEGRQKAAPPRLCVPSGPSIPEGRVQGLDITGVAATSGLKIRKPELRNEKCCTIHSCRGGHRTLQVLRIPTGQVAGGRQLWAEGAHTRAPGSDSVPGLGHGSPPSGT